MKSIYTVFHLFYLYKNRFKFYLNMDYTLLAISKSSRGLGIVACLEGQKINKLQYDEYGI